MAPEQHNARLPWPYFEGLTLAEAMNDLTLLTVGIYGHILPPQHGAPIRLIVPWKYGFKSIKSITNIELTDENHALFGIRSHPGNMTLTQMSILMCRIHAGRKPENG